MISEPEEPTECFPRRFGLHENVHQFPKPQPISLYGKWNWQHNGKDTNGQVSFHKNGLITHSFSDEIGSWRQKDDIWIELTFDDIKHVMILSEDKKNLILYSPIRNPPTTANLKVPTLCLKTALEKNLQELVKIQLDGVAIVKAQYTVNQGGDTRNEFPINLIKGGT